MSYKLLYRERNGEQWRKRRRKRQIRIDSKGWNEKIFEGVDRYACMCSL